MEVSKPSSTHHDARKPSPTMVESRYVVAWKRIYRRYRIIGTRRTQLLARRVRWLNDEFHNFSYPYTHKYTSHRYFSPILVTTVIIALLMLGSCTYFKAKNKAHKSIPVPVVVASVLKADMPIYVSALGAVTPTYNVTVKTQINGQLLRVLFKEGQMVKTGELLAEIDPRPYQAQLTQFEGQLARDSALLANAVIDLKRYETLFKQDSVSQQTLETQKWLVKQYEGNIKLDQGQIESVKVNLIYCEITSPIDGRVGLRLVDPGNFVQTSDTTGLFVINTLQPITVIFSIPEDNLPRVMQKIAVGKTLQVEAYDRTQNTLLETGKLLTIDNQIDPTTGTVKIKAEFDNKNNILFPNQFVNVQLLVDTLSDATVVPTAAIQNGAKGTFIFLVNDNQTVSIRPVTVIATNKDSSAITTGIMPGKLVVIEGTDKLTDGVAITSSIRSATSDPNRDKNL